MASTHIFGVSYRWGRTATWDRERRHDIAEQHGCDWTEIWDVASGRWKSWFSCPNRGEPFDSQTADAVMRDVSEKEEAT